MATIPAADTRRTCLAKAEAGSPERLAAVKSRQAKALILTRERSRLHDRNSAEHDLLSCVQAWQVRG